MPNISVMVVDDDEDMRSLVRLLFDLEHTVDLVGEADSCAGGVAVWRTHRPDVVVLDYRMPDDSGLVAAREILGDDPNAVIVMFSAFMTDAAISEAQSVGVRAFVPKDHVRALVACVTAIGRDPEAALRQ